VCFFVSTLLLQVIGNFGTVFVDQSYWQGAIGGGSVTHTVSTGHTVGWQDLNFV
jgi:hypothetical protein